MNKQNFNKREFEILNILEFHGSDLEVDDFLRAIIRLKTPFELHNLGLALFSLKKMLAKVAPNDPLSHICKNKNICSRQEVEAELREFF